ncbi:MAG: metallophosphoesterase [Chloroflexi bacterium]|nr:metallophosphoesterase [Chloroflexota bacterium]
MKRSIRLAVGLLIVALVALFNQPSIPAVRATTTNSIRFAIIGDYGWDTVASDGNEAAVAGQVKSWNPDFIITVGDNNYPDGKALTIDANIGKYYAEYIYPYTGAYTKTATVNRFFPTLGNHDWHTPGATPYLNYFTLPGNERYYDFVRSMIHFFALDSDPSEPDGITSTSVQATWLRNQLAASTSCWNLVYFHHAPYSSGPHGASGGDAGKQMRWQFGQWGADAVFSGHDHDYERIHVGGIPYFVNGSGGAPLYDFIKPYVAGSQFRNSTHFGAMRVTATSTQLTYEFIATNGTIIDTYTQKGGCAIFLPLVLR